MIASTNVGTCHPRSTVSSEEPDWGVNQYIPPHNHNYNVSMMRVLGIHFNLVQCYLLRPSSGKRVILRGGGGGALAVADVSNHVTNPFFQA